MALATSKRKFYKLLDNLSRSNLPSSESLAEGKNPSTASIDAAAADTENNTAAGKQRGGGSDPPPKRTRMLAQSSTQPRVSLQQRPGATTAGPSRTSVRIISSNFESRTASSFTTTTAAQPPQASSSAASPPTSTTTVSSNPELSVYAPWNHEYFLARLKTFADVKTWSPKPKGVDEVAWAKRGWINVGSEEVSCRSCGKRLVVKLETVEASSNKCAVDGKNGEDETEGQKWWIEEAEKRLEERYESLVVEGHSEGCLWRKSGCKDDIYRIRFSDVTVWQNELLERYNSLLDMVEELPSNVNTPSYSESDGLTINDIIKWFDAVRAESKDVASSKSETRQQTHKVALTLALCGWSGQKLAGVRFGYCTKCFSRVGFWLYQTESNDGGLSLDPISLHRAHCPWHNPESQCGYGDYADLAAWQIMGRVISVRVSRSERNKPTVTKPVGGELDDGTESVDYRPSTGVSTFSRTREEVDLEDKMRESKLARLKKAFTVRRAKSRVVLTSSANTSKTGL